MPGLNLKKIAARLGGRTPDVGFGVAAGAAADTNITITGIKVGDIIVAAVQFPPPNDTGTVGIFNRTAVAKVTAANTVQFTAQATNSPANSIVALLWLSTGK